VSIVFFFILAYFIVYARRFKELEVAEGVTAEIAASNFSPVMAGLVPAIPRLCLPACCKTWIPGTRPGMTEG
jgi:hypothetical protein